MVGGAGVDVAEEPVSVRFMPTSITVAPALTMSAPIMCAADRGDEDVGVERVPLEIDRAGWQIVTVAFACRRRCAIGLPTLLLITPTARIRAADRWLIGEILAHDALDTSPRRARAALTVFFKTMAIVIGPTPPGTGVM